MARPNATARLLVRNPLALAGLALIAIFLLCAIFGPVMAPQDPARIDLPSRLAGAFCTAPVRHR